MQDCAILVKRYTSLSGKAILIKMWLLNWKQVPIKSGLI